MNRQPFLLISLAVLGLSLFGCGGSASGPDSDVQGVDGNPPFMGENIKFHSTYVYFPTDFSVALVRDTMPQEDACRILKMYSMVSPPFAGLPALPYEQEHYTLLLNVDSVANHDDVTLDPNNRGSLGNMRYGFLALFGVGKNRAPTTQWLASGTIRISDLNQHQSMRGEFRLQFPTGEHIEESFDVNVCP